MSNSAEVTSVDLASNLTQVKTGIKLASEVWMFFFLFSRIEKVRLGQGSRQFSDITCLVDVHLACGT